MNLLVVLFILGFVSVGFSSTYATSINLRFEERVCFGVVIGSVMISIVGFAVASLVGATGLMVLITVAFCVAMVSPLVFLNKKTIISHKILM